MIGQRVLLCVVAAVAALSTSSTSVAHAKTLRGPTQTAAASSFHQAMLESVNAERAKAGKAKLCFNNKLQSAAQLHSEDQAQSGKMSHTGSNGSQLSQRVAAQSFKWAGVGENVAAGQRDVAQVMNAWMTSDGHRRNILGEYKFFGMGYATSSSSGMKHYWTQVFANGNGESCDDGGGGNQDEEVPTPTPTPTPSEGDMNPRPTPSDGGMRPRPTPSDGGMRPRPTPSDGGWKPRPTPSEGGWTPAPRPVTTPCPASRSPSAYPERVKPMPSKPFGSSPNSVEPKKPKPAGSTTTWMPTRIRKRDCRVRL